MVKKQQVQMKMLAKVLNIICNVAFWITAAAFGLFIIANIVLLFIPEKNLVISANISGSLAATINGTQLFKFDPQSIGDIMIKYVLQAVFLWVSVVLLIASAVLFEVKRILKTVVEDKPFEKGNSKNLTIISLVLIAASFILPIFEGRVFSAAIKTLQVGNISIGYSMNWTLLLTGILILMLAGVFQYGNYLQEEVDSTL
jgi:Protein of unknown function (DUF2975)